VEMKNYPEQYQELCTWMETLGQKIPGPMTGFSKLHESAIAPGALDSKVKELIALAIAITVRCDGCIAFHVHDALSGGATPEEIAETVGVAVMMGGGPSVVYGIEAMQAVQQFEAQK
tara:strand:+ start:3038 stop:3388 length:351 start_codon:yes stop_codon:yes gene_type:complete